VRVAGFVGLITLLFPASCASAAAPISAEPIADKGVREAALKALFPGTEVHEIPARYSGPTATVTGIKFPNAMDGAPVYAVVGRPLDKIETCAAEDLANEETEGRTRLVTWKAFRWPGQDSALLLFAQYYFVDASPSLACPSVAVVARLDKQGDSWTLGERSVLETTHHWAVQRVELLDLAGTGADYLLVESDFGGAGAVFSSLELFDLSHRKLEEVLNTESRAVYVDSDLFTRVIDIAATRAAHAATFCTTKTALMESGHKLNPPRILRECLPRGSGVN
jgi:hypothetical protein